MSSPKREYRHHYLDALLDLTARAGGNFGLDEVLPVSLPKEDLIDAFRKEFRCKDYPLELAESDHSLSEAYKEFFGLSDEDFRLAEAAAELTENKFGKTGKICYPKERGKLLDVIGGTKGPFYTVTDLFFVFFEKEVLCIVSGNFE